MNSPYLPPEELLRLLGGLADEGLTDDQERRLAEILRDDPEARAYYLDYLSMATSLQWEYAAAAAAGEPEGQSPPAGAGRPRGFVLLSLAGLAGLAAGLLLGLLLPWQRPAAGGRPAAEWAGVTDEGVAVLLETYGAEWDKTAAPPRPDGPIPAGRLSLKSGLAHVQFYNGATVLLEGPTDLQLVSPREAYCARGKLRAHVPPPAKGFTIGTPKLDVVDLGTEFGLWVDGAGGTEVHVFQGKVRTYDAGSPRSGASWQEVAAGRGLRREKTGADRFIPADPSAFLTPDDLRARAAALRRSRHRAWQASGEALRRDPRLVVYYTFENDQPGSRTLPDQVAGRQPPRDGTIVGCAWAAGRWPGKHALEFKRPGDRVRLTVPGEYASLTLMTWVRIDSLDHDYTGLLLTDKGGEGSAHWEISRRGELILRVKHWKNNRSRTGPVLGPETLGRWVHLAVAYDQSARRITHYVNGRAVAIQEMPQPIGIKIGSAEIGNWGNPYRGQDRVPVRNLNGRMDEFLAFNQALGPKEIQELYEAGKPVE